jgi:phage terminase small subunit
MKAAFLKLEPATRKWITSLKKRLVLEDYHERLLILAGQAWDRAQQAARTIEADGPVQTDRFGQKKPHPSIQIEAVSMLNFCKLLRESGIDLERPDEPRPKRQY